MNRKNGADGIARSEIKEFSNAWLDEVVEYRSDLLVTVGTLLAVAAAAAAIGYAAPFVLSYITVTPSSSNGGLSDFRAFGTTLNIMARFCLHIE